MHTLHTVAECDHCSESEALNPADFKHGDPQFYYFEQFVVSQLLLWVKAFDPDKIRPQTATQSSVLTLKNLHDRKRVVSCNVSTIYGKSQCCCMVYILTVEREVHMHR